jgi:Ca2+-binding EF-hand superfamily protein
MASDFQRRKVTGVFTAMDADSDGFLDEQDFRALTDRWVAIRGDGDHERLSMLMMGWWATLLAASDLDRDNKVTLDEILLVVDQLGTMTEAVAGTADAMFEAIDENADGLISAEEYRRMIEAWNGRETDTDLTFPILDTDGDGQLSRTEFAELWTEFWAGNDPEAAGALVFGPLVVTLDR